MPRLRISGVLSFGAAGSQRLHLHTLASVTRNGGSLSKSLNECSYRVAGLHVLTYSHRATTDGLVNGLRQEESVRIGSLSNQSPRFAGNHVK
jgi:hypothetical protein